MSVMTKDIVTHRGPVGVQCHLHQAKRHRSERYVKEILGNSERRRVSSAVDSTNSRLFNLNKCHPKENTY